ncbi:hypothetical protein PL263_05725 [Methylomonas sp. EFPC3]|uniref:hypothetical protein n=1 Tax=Methylomonas sp. EFPC3 TaxID=3021710 RepID=UPI002416E87D|nr:hypothetical protein [Methylomonas sp. EFPC3]WFP51526.1 hypothetical protein PL263_05725 [Methylomonas sp. EFPC3]
MNSSVSELDAWLTGSDLQDDLGADDSYWLAGFDADRQVVLVKLGPYQKLYLRPKQFIRRFYHTLYPLPVESWPYRRQITLFEGFCTLDLALDLRFQATFDYALKNAELLPDINAHIRNVYAAMVEDAVNLELQTLADGNWVNTGLADAEKRIAQRINELLAQQQIQSLAVCRLNAGFAEFPDAQLGRDAVYVNVLKKTFELNQTKNLELSRQQRLLEEEEIHEKRQQLEHLRRMIDLEQQMQALEAEKQRRLAEDKFEQLTQQLAIEKRLHAEQLRHDTELQEMRFEAELLSQEKRQVRQRSAENRQLTDQLAHRAGLHEQEVLAELRMQQRARTLMQEHDLAEPTGGEHGEA